MSNDFIGTLDNDRARTVVRAGDTVTVRLSEASYLREGALTLVAEIRTMADGRVFLGVSVRPDPSGAPVLEWSNIGDPARWILPGQDVDRGGKWPDVTPRVDIDPESLEGRRRSAAWARGERHRYERKVAMLARGDVDDVEVRPDAWDRWDASDWAAAAAEYWILRREAADAERPEVRS